MFEQIIHQNLENHKIIFFFNLINFFSEQNYDWSKSRDAPAVYRAVLLRNRRAEALNSIGTQKVKTLPFGGVTLSPAAQTPTKRAPTKRSRAQLDFSKMEAPVAAPVEAKKAKIATKLTMRPKNQQGKF